MTKICRNADISHVMHKIAALCFDTLCKILLEFVQFLVQIMSRDPLEGLSRFPAPVYEQFFKKVTLMLTKIGCYEHICHVLHEIVSLRYDAV